MAIAVRRHVLDGLCNCRDLGGYPTEDGRVTKYGVFLRSELPRQLSERDMAYLLDTVGVRLSLDLRSTPETVASPSALRGVPGVDYLHASLIHEAAAMGEEKVAAPPPPPGEGMDWGEVYVEMLEEARETWPKLVLGAIARTEGAVQYNCTTGKDRTGILTALLLGLAGVSDADIVADYCVSQVYLGPVYAQMGHLLPAGESAAGKDGELASPFFYTRPAFMQRLLTHLNEKYGGIPGYVRAAGVDEDTIAAIRAKFVG